MSKNNVALIYSDKINDFDYGSDHPMKMERASMTFDLMNKYEILHQFNIYVKSKGTSISR